MDSDFLMRGACTCSIMTMFMVNPWLQMVVNMDSFYEMCESYVPTSFLHQELENKKITQGQPSHLVIAVTPKP